VSSGPGLPGPAAGVTDDTVAFAAALVDRSGIAGQAEAALARRAGRRRALPVRAVLTALLCLAPDDRPLHLTEATRVLFCRISDASRVLLGVTGAITGRRGFLAACRRVRYCFHAILSTAGPSALPKNRRLTPGQLTAASKKMTPAQATAARGRLEALINSLLEASVSVLDDAERAARDGSAGLDATAVPLFSRGPSKRAGLAASDPDGGWYVREGDHRDREDHKGKTLRKIARAPEATIATMARPPGTGPACPNLAAGLALARPGEDPAAPAPGYFPPSPHPAANRLARLRPRLHRRAARTVPPARPRPGLPARHGLPRRPARHPGQHQRGAAGRGHLALPRAPRAAGHRHR
jgi:hypothetical protein